MTKHMEIVAVCQEMGWTYYEYMSQPTWFLDLLREKLIIDSEKTKREIQKAKSFKK